MNIFHKMDASGTCLICSIILIRSSDSRFCFPNLSPYGMSRIQVCDDEKQSECRKCYSPDLGGYLEYGIIAEKVDDSYGSHDTSGKQRNHIPENGLKKEELEAIFLGTSEESVELDLANF